MRQLRIDGDNVVLFKCYPGRWQVVPSLVCHQPVMTGCSTRACLASCFDAHFMQLSLSLGLRFWSESCNPKDLYVHVLHNVGIMPGCVSCWLEPLTARRYTCPAAHTLRQPPNGLACRKA